MVFSLEEHSALLFSAMHFAFIMKGRLLSRHGGGWIVAH